MTVGQTRLYLHEFGGLEAGLGDLPVVAILGHEDWAGLLTLGQLRENIQDIAAPTPLGACYTVKTDTTFCRKKNGV